MNTRRSYRIRMIAVILLAATWLVPGSAWSDLLNYTMVFDSVNGTYDGNTFTGQTLTFSFTANTANVAPWSLVPSYSLIRFENGADVRITLGSILINAPLDDLASNGIALMATGERIFMGTATAASGGYGEDRMGMFAFDNAPDPASAVAMLTTGWTSIADPVSTSTHFGSTPLTINGSTLFGDPGQNTTGSWNSQAIPEPSSMMLLALGGTSVLALRRRKGKLAAGGGK